MSDSISRANLPRVRIERDGGMLHLTFPRRTVDGVAVREMYEAAADYFDDPHLKLLVDFTGVPLINSGMMGMLVTLRKKLLQSGGQMHVLIPDPQVMQTLQIMNLHLVLTLFSEPEAARRFKG